MFSYFILPRSDILKNEKMYKPDKMNSDNSLPLSPKKILVVAMPYLGDVLLATPLFHSLKKAYPDSQLDALVFSSTAAMLEGNSDISHIITTPNRPTFVENWQLLKQIFRRYDLAMAIQTGDRPFFYTLLAAPFRINVVPSKKSKTGWKRFFVQRWTEFDNENTHTVLQNLKLLDLINIPRCFSLVPPRFNNIQSLNGSFPFLTETRPFVVLHPFPQWKYKRWTKEGWIEVGHYLNKLGLRVALSGGGAKEELDNISYIVNHLPADTVNLAGQVSLAQLAHIIAQAKLFIGPDTGITHLAAATGTPVIAIYGPTNPVKWSPWPYGYQASVNPFARKGNQHVNNIYFVQGAGDCVPCALEGCERHQQSRSQCLDDILPSDIKCLIPRMLN
jgi:heptosyltransferase-3